MEEYNDYDAAAATIKIEDITTDKINRKILRQLKENGPDFDKVWVMSNRDVWGEEFRRYCYCPEGAHDFGWLGYFIGKNTHLEEFLLRSNPFKIFAIEPFCRGVNRNRSIQKIELICVDLSGGEFFQWLHL